MMTEWIDGTSIPNSAIIQSNKGRIRINKKSLITEIDDVLDMNYEARDIPRTVTEVVDLLFPEDCPKSQHRFSQHRSICEEGDVIDCNCEPFTQRVHVDGLSGTWESHHAQEAWSIYQWPYSPSQKLHYLDYMHQNDPDLLPLERAYTRYLHGCVDHGIEAMNWPAFAFAMEEEGWHQ